MPVAKDGNIVKIGVEMDKSIEGNFIPQLIEFDQKRNLNLIIQDLCSHWNITDYDQYSLQFIDQSNNAYITEKNRNEVKNGSFLRMTLSASRTAQDILNTLQFDEGDQRREAFVKLVKLSNDYTFALEFINKQGLQFLIDSIEKDEISYKDGFGLSLESFVDLMDHGIISWDNLEPKFIGRIAKQVNSAGSSPNFDSKVLIKSLAILESIVISGTKFNSLVEHEVTLPNLISNIQQNTANPEVQQNSIALINALFSKSDLSKRKAMAATLGSKHIRNVIYSYVISPKIVRQEVEGADWKQFKVNVNVGSEMAHQLYVLQSLLFNLHEERQYQVPNQQNEAETRDKILELRKLYFESELIMAERHGGKVTPILGSGTVGFQEDYKRLGFSNYKNPVEDFQESPPGLLALDMIMYFARNYTENYVKIVYENSLRSDREHECPFVKSSIQLTKLICEISKVNEPPTDEGKQFYPLFFRVDHPLEEFFSTSIIVLNKTWKEMRAGVEDFVKVFSVLKKQLTLALSDPNSTVSIDDFKKKLIMDLPYSKIIDLWQTERNSREEWENKAQAILELKEMVKPEIIDLIKQQRLLYLTEGTQFVKYSSKGQRVKDKFWYCRLSSNHKFFCYGDCDENTIPSVDELPQKFAVIDIKQLVTGKDCPHMKDNKSKKSTFALAFSLIPDSEQEEPLNFVAPNEKTFDYWTDGINALLDQEMTSKETNNDLEMLLSMEIKLRLLDTEGVMIPAKPPELPPSPPNYDFHNLKQFMQ